MNAPCCRYGMIRWQEEVMAKEATVLGWLDKCEKLAKHYSEQFPEMSDYLWEMVKRNIHKNTAAVHWPE